MGKRSIQQKQPRIMKTKPITQKAKCNYSEPVAPSKYMSALVNDLKGMYGSKKFIAGADSMKKGFDDVADLNQKFSGGEEMLSPN
jgi:hypothetical protein